MKINETILCECNLSFNENDFLKHFKSCKILFDKYKDFDYKISQLLKNYIDSQNSLSIIKFLFKRFINIFEYKLKNYFNVNINSKIIDNINNDKNNDFNLKYNEYKASKINENYKKLISKEENLPNKKNISENSKFPKIITTQLFSNSFYHYRACIFSSIKDDNIYVVYGVYSGNLEYYDISNNNKKNPSILFKKLFTQPFVSCRYYLDKENKRDLLIICSDKYVKIINFEKEKSSIILFLNFQNKNGNISTSYIINNNIIVPFSSTKKSTIEFYDFKNNFVKLLEEKLDFVYSIDNYYWKNKEINYVIITYAKGIVVYDDKFTKFKKIFKGPEDKKDYLESYIINKNESLILVGCYSLYSPGYLYFWNVEKGDLLYSIPINSGITGISILNNNLMFISLYNGKSPFALININEKKIIKEFTNEKDKDKDIFGIKILKHKTKGDYLISMSVKGKLNLYKI